MSREPAPEGLARNQLTVVVPNRNHGRFIEESLRAILTQSLKPHRVVVVDDDSSDSSLSAIKSVQKEFPELELECNATRLGVLKTCNRWMRKVETEFLYFAAADDFVLPGFFEKTIGLMTKYPEAPVCVTFTRVIDENGAEIENKDPYLDQPTPHFIEPGDALNKFTRYGNFISGNTCLYRTAALCAAGGYAEDLRAFGDGYVLTVTAVSQGMCVVPERLATKRHLDTGIAGTMVRDIDGSLETLEKALNRMRDKFPGALPPRFLRRFEARWRYGIVREALSRGELATGDIFRAMGSTAFLDRAMIGLTRMLTKPGGRFPKTLLWVRMCPFDVLTALKFKLTRT